MEEKENQLVRELEIERQKITNQREGTSDKEYDRVRESERWSKRK